MSAFADTAKSGTCGDNLTWTLQDGVLTISGTGDMRDYLWRKFSGKDLTTAPWGVYYDTIKSVVIEAGVTTIGEDAFESCSSLTSINVDNNNEYYSSSGGVLFDKNQTILICYPAGKTESNYTIPGSVTSIVDDAFYKCSSLTNVTIPDSVTSIGDWAFSGCSNLTSVTIGSGVTTIGSSVFRNCSSLASVTIPNSVTSIGGGAFEDCSSLESVTIGNSVSSIGDEAFNGCSSLTDVYFGGSEEQWNQIDIQLGNYNLTNATIHYSGTDEHEHIYTFAVIAPTCTEKGYTTHTCACGDSYVDSYTNALGHSYKNGKCVRCNAADPTYIAAPTLKITTSAGKPKLTWNKVDGATKYYIYRSTDGKNYKQYTSTTKTSYTNTSTTIGTTYYYKVKAAKVVNGKNVYSVYSNVNSVKCVPAAPVVSISRSNGKPKLTWKAVTGASKYYIYRSTDGTKFSYLTNTSKTSYINSGASSGTKYYYKVTAVAVINDEEVESGTNAAKSMITTLKKPTVKITTANGKPKLTWNAVTGANKYEIYRSIDGVNYNLLYTTTSTAFTNTGAKKNTKYYYKVKAICNANSNANSTFSNIVSIKATK